MELVFQSPQLLSPQATITEPKLHKKWSQHSEKPACDSEEQAPRAATGENPTPPPRPSTAENKQIRLLKENGRGPSKIKVGIKWKMLQLQNLF